MRIEHATSRAISDDGLPRSGVVSDDSGYREEASTTRSPRGFFGAIAILLVIPTAAVFSAAFDDDEVGVHIALATGAFLLASAMFDFDIPRPVNLLAVVCTTLLGGIFLLQAISPLTSNDEFHDYAYETLGQWLEGTLTLAFVIWCFVLLLSDSKDRTRLLGWVTVPLLLIYATALWLTSLMGVDQPPGILKLLFMPVMVWLLLESRKPPTRDHVEEHQRL